MPCRIYFDSVFLGLMNPYKNTKSKFQIALQCGLKSGRGGLSFPRKYIPLQGQGIKFQNPNTDHNPFNKTHRTEPILKALPANLTTDFYHGAFKSVFVLKGRD